MHKATRGIVLREVNYKEADKILKELLSKKNVDGGLIGGASLKPADFAKIVEATNQ